MRKSAVFVLLVTLVTVAIPHFIDESLGDGFWSELSGMMRERRFLFHQVQPSDLVPGDHIYTKRYLGLYTHHGIFVGKHGELDDAVVHFQGTTMSSAHIHVVSLQEFRGWQAWKLRRVQYGVARPWLWIKFSGSVYAEPSDEPEVVVQRALEWTQSTLPYDLFERNCEGLSYHCKTGKPWHSAQASLVPSWSDVKAPPRLIFKLKHWFLKVVGTFIELGQDIAAFEL